MFADLVRQADADDSDGPQYQAGGAADGHEDADGCETADSDGGLGSLRYGELESLVVELAQERSRIEGRYMAALAEMTSRVGSQAAAYQLRELTRMSAPQARCEAQLAETLADQGMTDTLDAMAAGRIHMSHAKVIARESPKKHRRSEADFLELSSAYPAHIVARHTLANYSNQIAAELAAEAAAADLSPVEAELLLQRHQRWGSMRIGDDGMWHLRGKFDYVTGRELNSALQATLRSLRHRHEAHAGSVDDGCSGAAGSQLGDGGGDERPDGGGNDALCASTPKRGQLTADALSELIAGTSAARRASTGLLIIADYDAVNDRLVNPRLDDGTPLPARELAERAIDAKVLPAVFKADWSELALGRTRNASDAQRLILAARDGGCIGCELASEHTQGHHIDYYENGGHTEIANLASLCWDCHRDLHRRHRGIEIPPDGRPRLQPPEPANTDASGRDPTATAALARSP